MSLASSVIPTSTPTTWEPTTLPSCTWVATYFNLFQPEKLTVFFQTSHEMAATFISFRPRGILNSNTTVAFFPNGGAIHQLELPNVVNIEVFSPNWCPAAIPPMVGVSTAFCSVVNSPNAPACNLPLEGSPLIAAPNTLVGILLNRAGCLPAQGNVFLLQYHNVGEFLTWINQTSGSKMNAFSLVLILSSILISLKNLI